MAIAKLCSVEGCGKAVRTRDYCANHYERFRKYGDPLAGRASPRELCTVDGCANRHEALGFCRKHYDKYQKYGDPCVSVVLTQPGEPLGFLESHASFSGSACLIWPYSRYPSGYGQVRYESRSCGAHRAMCILAHGEPPSPLHVAAHSCGNGVLGCVHPGHLRWATESENQNDKVLHGTSNRGERCGTAKLKEADVRAIRSLVGRMTQAGIARTFGVHVMTVNSIVHGRNWGWLQ